MLLEYIDIFYFGFIDKCTGKTIFEIIHQPLIYQLTYIADPCEPRNQMDNLLFQYFPTLLSILGTQIQIFLQDAYVDLLGTLG